MEDYKELAYLLYGYECQYKLAQEFCNRENKSPKEIIDEINSWGERIMFTDDSEDIF